MSLNDNFKIAILPIDIAEGDKTANLNKVSEHLDRLPEGTDLLVLPELFSTGYINNSEEAMALAEDNNGETMEILRRAARENHIAICGSYLSTDGTSLYNRGFILEPNGDSAYYDKRHLFCLSKEADVCRRGSKLPPVVRYRGWNLCLAICYDLRFPVWLRNTGNKYDVLILPANWPEKRAYAWHQLLKARAIENVCYTVGANRSGEDEYGRYTGLSQAYDYLGKEISHTDGDFVTAILDRPALKNFREHFPVWTDADDFRILL